MLVAQLCLTLCDPMDCSSAGSSVPGILQAGILEWVTIPFSRGSSWPRNQTWVFCIAGRFFTVWATREARGLSKHSSRINTAQKTRERERRKEKSEREGMSTGGWMKSWEAFESAARAGAGGRPGHQCPPARESGRGHREAPGLHSRGAAAWQARACQCGVDNTEGKRGCLPMKWLDNWDFLQNNQRIDACQS